MTFKRSGNAEDLIVKGQWYTAFKSPLTQGFLFMLPFFLAACQPRQAADEDTLFNLRDSTETGIGFVNNLPDNDSLSILDYHYYYNGAGVAAGDLNNDGLPDLFFVSNRGKNKLYINKGKNDKDSFDFEEVSFLAGIEGAADWQTGVAMADVNGDGWLDIYVCAVSGGYMGLQGSNELYINNGPNADGLVTFTEQAAAYGLDFSGFSTQAAFFDYDEDGDLDMYLLNHAVHTAQSYGKVSARSVKDEKSGDILFENQLFNKNAETADGAVHCFKDVSEQAGIFQAPMGYGLGIVVADLNNDGWDDIYVANDFHEDDYYYINNGNGTFTESLTAYFSHTSRFSMGCDAADLNNDGYPDLMTLDMYPDDEEVLKASGGEDPFDIFLYKLSYGYSHQYSRNCLQLNLSGEKFSDIGVMSGVAATDWSWSTLMADFDNDGQKDIFIANGIVRRPNDLDYIKYVSNSVGLLQASSVAGTKSFDAQAIALMPEGKVPNYLFKGTENLRFEDKSLEWGFGQPTLSNGAVYVDLDGDGDLDLVTNNINEPAGIYENMNEKHAQHHYLKIKLQGQEGNLFGIGAKVILKHQGKVQMQQLMPTRGFLSSVEPVLNFGLGSWSEIDTLIVMWGNQRAEIRTNVVVNTTLLLSQRDATAEARQHYNHIFAKAAPLLEEISSEAAVDYVHQENQYYDFYRESLMPFLLSTEGPKIAVEDVNGDGLDDFYVGGARGQAGKLFLQQENDRFTVSNEQVFKADAAAEDVDAVFFDANGNGYPDLYVVSGGNEFYGMKEELFDRLYLNDGKGNFTRAANHLPPMFTNGSCVRPVDFNGDGHLDLFVGGRVVSYRYGETPDSYLLINDGKGKFSDQTAQLAPGLGKAGMLTDAQWVDTDGDGDMDLVLVGDWMPIKIFEKKEGRLLEMEVPGLEKSKGFWQTIQTADFDGDGDMDFIVGNMGTNSKLRKQASGGLQLHVKDIDGNKVLDHILAYQLEDKQWYPVATKDELAKQLPLLNKKFTSYQKFAGKTVEEVFDKGELEGANVLSVDMFESVYLENLGKGRFRIHVLPAEAQVSKIFALHIEDIDGDGHQDVLLGGNLYGVSTYQGRYDAGYGLLLKGNGAGNFSSILPTDAGFVLEGEVRNIKTLNTANEELLLVARNNLPLQLFRKKKPADVPTTNQTLNN